MTDLYFHVDMDAFFASVEIKDDPTLAGKPVLIGHEGKRSVVATASYEARKYGCHSAMPMTTALRLCPQAVVVPPHFERYREISQTIMRIFRSYSDEVLQVSIDEAFLTMTRMERLWSDAKSAARALKREVKEATGLTISIGIAPNRYLAKMASDYDKPDGLCRVAPGKELRFVDAVGLDHLWGIGASTRRALDKAMIRTTAEARTYRMETLQDLLGRSTGSFVWNAVRGIDPGIYQGEAKSHSISTETTFPEDITDGEILRAYLLEMAHDVMFRALKERQIARSVSLKLRWPDFTSHEAQVTPEQNILSADQVYRYAVALLSSRWKEGMPVRLMGLGLGNLYAGSDPRQQELFSGKEEKRRALERTILDLRKRGSAVVKAATLLDQRK